jgi:hypothetical protein
MEEFQTENASIAIEFEIESLAYPKIITRRTASPRRVLL